MDEHSRSPVANKDKRGSRLQEKQKPKPTPASTTIVFFSLLAILESNAQRRRNYTVAAINGRPVLLKLDAALDVLSS
ncbi:unnamed protein product [Mesocestoides corti]|uniref:Uncharacterized protein n=1 Tax=Mesocestoides corti TaxID=53468 RepID=A0A0R3U9M1_MESCO|nr:unnamed protein product [Mesocestoides corti]